MNACAIVWIKLIRKHKHLPISKPQYSLPHIYCPVDQSIDCSIAHSSYQSTFTDRFALLL